MKNIFFSESMLESMPQIMILFCLAMKDQHLIIGSKSTLFWMTFSTSILSASFALANFLKTGPCRLVPNNGRLGGYFEKGFICLFICNLCTILIKGMSLAARNTNTEYMVAVYWLSFNLLPQFLFVSLFTCFIDTVPTPIKNGLE